MALTMITIMIIMIKDVWWVSETRKSRLKWVMTTLGKTRMEVKGKDQLTKARISQLHH
jgi:hypothetical protein